MTRRCVFRLLLLIPLAAAPAVPSRAEDLVILKGGSSQSGMVMELGGNRIELHVAGGTRTILKGDIEKIVLDANRETRAAEASDGIVRVGGHIIRGQVELLDGGERVQVTLPGGGRATFPRKEVHRILRRGDLVEYDTTVYTRDLHRRLGEALERLGKGADAEAERFLGNCGSLAIGRVLDALAVAPPGSPPRAALERLVRLHRLKEAVATPLEEAEPKIYEILSVPGSKEKLDLLALLFPRFLEESAPLAAFLATDASEDPTVRAWSVDYLRRMRRNLELVRIFTRTAGQTQLAAAIALGQNRMLIGVPSLIEALEMDSAEMRALASKSLKEITNQDFQFRPEGTPQARKEAIERWRAWWQLNEKSLVHAAEAVLRSNGAEAEVDSLAASPERVLAVKLWKEAGLEADAKRYEMAESLLRQAVDKDPMFLQASLALSVVLYGHLDRPAEAARFLIEARNKRFSGLRKEQRQWIYLHLGNALRLTGDAKGAAEAYENCRAIAPANFQALVGLSDVTFARAVSEEVLQPAERKELLKSALIAVRGAIQLTDDLLKELVILRSDQVGERPNPGFDRREYNRAVLQLRKANRHTRHELVLKLAKIQARDPDPKEALITLKELIDALTAENEPEEKKLEAEARCYLGLLYEDNRQPLLAWREYRKVLQDLNADHPDARAGFERVRQQVKDQPQRSGN